MDGESFKMIPADEYSPRAGVGSGVQVITDSMDLTWHPATGEHFSSKSQFRKATKASGCVEIGGERIKPKDNYSGDGIKQDLIRAFENAR